MLIPGDDQIGVAGECAGQHMIIIGIALNHGRHRLGRGHVRQAAQIGDDALRRQTGLREARRELPARDHIEQFRQERRAAAQLEDLRPCAIDQTARRTARRNHPRHQRIGVQHDPHNQARRAARSWRAA